MANFYNDDQMEYNIELHQYRLTENGINDILQDEELLINFNTLTALVSNAFYSYCIGLNLLQRDQVIWFLSLPNLRPYIKEALKIIFEDLVINRTNQVIITDRAKEFIRSYNLGDKSKLAYSNRYEHIDIIGEDY